MDINTKVKAINAVHEIYDVDVSLTDEDFNFHSDNDRKVLAQKLLQLGFRKKIVIEHSGLTSRQVDCIYQSLINLNITMPLHNEDSQNYGIKRILQNARIIYAASVFISIYKNISKKNIREKVDLVALIRCYLICMPKFDKLQSYMVRVGNTSDFSKKFILNINNCYVLAEALLNDELHFFACPTCHVEYPVFFDDIRDRTCPYCQLNHMFEVCLDPVKLKKFK